MSATQMTIKNVEVDKIEVREGFNVRSESDPSYIRTLAEDIHLHGILTPLQVEPNGKTYFVVAGHGRLEAIKYANEHLNASIKTVPAIVKRDLDDTKRDEIMLSDRLARTLEPIAYAKAMQRMMEREGISQTQFAARYGVTVAYAGDLKLLANAPATVQQAVEEGVVSSTEAVRTLKEYGPEGAEEVVKALSDEVEKESAENPPAPPGSPSWVSDGQKDDGNTPATRRAKKTKKDTERVVRERNITPRKNHGTKIVPENSVEKVSVADLLSRVSFMVDNLVAQTKAGDEAAMRNKIVDLAHWLKLYQQQGYLIPDSMSGVKADTPDEDIDWLAADNISKAA